MYMSLTCIYCRYSWKYHNCCLLISFILLLCLQTLVLYPSTSNLITSTFYPILLSDEFKYVYDGYYMMTSVATDRDTAETNCVAYGGYLATITSSAQSDALVSVFSSQVSSPCGSFTNGTCFWIGYKRVSTYGSFVWADGSSYTYTNWNTPNPDNCGGSEACTVVMIHNSSRWSDVACSQSTDVCGGGTWGSYQGLCKKTGNTQFIINDIPAICF